MFAAGKTKGVVATAANYIEDVFSTYLYTGTGATNSIANNIDLAGKGGLVWIKNRTFTTNNFLADTARGIGGVGGSTYYVASNTTSAQSSDTNLMSVGATGFTLLPNATSSTNGSYDYASWTFRKQPKFFDVVTYTGNGSSTQTINHNLGSAPGCIIIKVTSQTDDWYVYHRSLSQSGGVPYWLNLNSTAAQQFFGGGIMLSADPTSTTFTVKGGVNGSGNTYVAYLFAHNAGSFGLTGTDNVISCGSFVTNSTGVPPTVTLGYEPQWILTKNASSVWPWRIQDNMRGSTADGAVQYLSPNTSGAEAPDTGQLGITSTGFGGGSGFGATQTYIYIAIRRGPMKVPTSGTSVFTPATYTGTNATRTSTAAGFPIDSILTYSRSGGFGGSFFDRLRGATKYLETKSAGAEGTGADSLTDFASMTGYTAGADTSTAEINYSGTYVNWFFRRAPSFFDEVCYTGANSTAPQPHNLGVVPELMIVKKRSGTSSLWAVYSAALGNTKVIVLNSSAAVYDDTLWNNTTPTATGFTLGANLGEVNLSGQTYVAYLFATCAGVSKVGSYTGNGTTQTINCGFTGGARFVLIKRTDSTGDWYVYDTARGMTTLTDPYLRLNSTAAESATLGSVTTVSTGFAVNASILAAINTNGASYIYLSIA